MSNVGRSATAARPCREPRVADQPQLRLFERKPAKHNMLEVFAEGSGEGLFAKKPLPGERLLFLFIRVTNAR